MVPWWLLIPALFGGVAIGVFLIGICSASETRDLVEEVDKDE